MRLARTAGWLLATVVFAGCSSQRARAAEVDRLVDVLDLREGSVVADVGAGDGEWTEQLALRVGESGHVYATEVDAELVEEIEQRIAAAALTNVTVVAGDQERTGLDAECCDAILLRMVYHHFERPAAMRADLARSLRPGGRLAIVDIVPQKYWRELDDVPDRGGHGISVEELVLEMATTGFELDARHDAWNDDEDRYCLVFLRPPAESGERP